MKKLYAALIELRPYPDCPHCSPEVAGAYVRSYVAAPSLQKAVKRMCTACQRGGFEVVSIDWCVDKDKVEWEHPDNASGAECMDRARTTGEVIFGELYTWTQGSEEEQ